MTLENISDNPLADMPTTQEISKSMKNFDITDYTVFVAMLVACCVVGVYFGFVKESSDENEYLVGGRNMKMIPISFSLIASFLSGIALLGMPSETYMYGTSFFFTTCGFIFVGFITSNVYLPVFHELRLTSIYEYLERRFDRKVRLLGSVLFSIYVIISLPIVVYAPALAFNQVTGVSVHIVTSFVCIVCIFYTGMGGLKAVVWTDVIQICIMFGSMLLIVIKGTNDLGGLYVVIRSNLESGRIEFPSTDWSPLTRHTIWSLVIGGGLYWLQFFVINQNMMQRYIALPSLQLARRALWCFLVGVVAMFFICIYTGLLMYAWYHNCDPLTTKLARTKDQLMPLLMMNMLGDFPGLPGLFMAGVFSAALSTLSTGLNSMAAVMLEDFVKPFIKTPLTRKASDIFLKLTVVILGVICVALVFIVEKAAIHVLQLVISLSSITSGPTLGIFSMGMLLPWINARGVLVGGLVGLTFMSWLTFSAEVAIATGKIKFETKPLTTEGCTYSFPQIENLPLFVPINTTLNDTSTEEPWAVYRLSYLWYTLVGTIVTVSISLIMTLFTSEDVGKLDPMLFAPFVRKYLRNSGRNVTTEQLHQIEITKSDVKMASRANKEDDKLLPVTAFVYR